MFISSYFPLYIFLLILQYNHLKSKLVPVTEQTTQEYPLPEIIFMVVLFIFFFLSFSSLVLLRSSADINEAIEIKNIKRANDSVVSYVFTYIIPITSFSFDNVPMLYVNGLLFLLIWFLYIKLNIIYLNPLWAIFGYISYEADSGYVISNMMIDDIMRAHKLRGYHLTNGIVVIQKQCNEKRLGG